MQALRGRELALKAEVLGVHEAIRSATAVNAALFSMADRIGTVEAGKLADLILLAGDPLADVRLFEDPANVLLVMRGGETMKDVRAARRGGP
ncbi:MAG TPA: amidohydrolase family protein [Candidatus Binatia bacterium]|jgi:imidazolonepropionase-like amidohydrolase|nr:amidohydrolase family protein [Candidatus Binatia bacterium]